MVACQRHFAGADEDGVVLSDVGLLAAGGEVAGADHGGLGDEHGDNEGLIVFPREYIHGEAEDGVVEQCAVAFDDIGARAGQLDAALEVEDAEFDAEGRVVFLLLS